MDVAEGVMVAKSASALGSINSDEGGFGGDTESVEDTSALIEVSEVRSIFPETWLWTEKILGYIGSIICLHIYVWLAEFMSFPVVSNL